MTMGKKTNKLNKENKDKKTAKNAEKKAGSKKGKNKKPSKKSESKTKKNKKDVKNKKSAVVDGVPTDKVYVKNSKIHGKGMFAAKKIKKDITLGPLLGYPTKKDGTYVLWLSKKKGLRVTNDFRFINHSKKPNCALTGTEVVTVRSIKPDEELTHHYGWED